MTLALLTQPETYVSLLTLTAMEVVLGIDNVIFISILTSKLPAAQQQTHPGEHTSPPSGQHGPEKERER